MVEVDTRRKDNMTTLFAPPGVTPSQVSVSDQTMINKYISLGYTSVPLPGVAIESQQLLPRIQSDTQDYQGEQPFQNLESSGTSQAMALPEGGAPERGVRGGQSMTSYDTMTRVPETDEVETDTEEGWVVLQASISPPIGSNWPDTITAKNPKTVAKWQGRGYRIVEGDAPIDNDEELSAKLPPTPSMIDTPLPSPQSPVETATTGEGEGFAYRSIDFKPMGWEPMDFKPMGYKPMEYRGEGLRGSEPLAYKAIEFKAIPFEAPGGGEIRPEHKPLPDFGGTPGRADFVDPTKSDRQSTPRKQPKHKWPTDSSLGGFR